MKIEKLQELETVLLSKNQIERLKILDEIATLPKVHIKNLLRSGLLHWDRLLREKCAIVLSDKFKQEAVPWIVNTYYNKGLPKSLVLDLIGQYDSRVVYRFLRKLSENSRSDISNRAKKYLKLQTCQEATLYQWRHGYSYEKHDLTIRLNKMSKNSLSSFIKKWKKDNKSSLLQDEDIIKYIDKRGLKELLEEPDESENLALTFSHDLAYSKLNQKLLKWGRYLLHTKTINNEYKLLKLNKKSGGIRNIYSPSPKLKAIQRAVHEKILLKQKLHPCCNGFCKSKSIKTNAEPHTGKKIVLNLDLKDFFPSISAARVYGIFSSIGFTRQQAWLLAGLTTINGYLPQGSPASPMLANLACQRLDKRLYGLSKKICADYTRYADDLTFSGNFNIVKAIPLITEIVKNEDFEIAAKKSRIIRQGNRQEVTGLTVNSKVTIPRKIRKKLRSVMHHMKQGKPVTWGNQDLRINRLKGLLSFLSSIEPEKGKIYLDQLKQHINE